MTKSKVVVIWSSDGGQRNALELLEDLPQLGLEHQEKLVASWKGNNLQIRISAGWARARIEIPGSWHGDPPYPGALNIVRPVFQSFLNSCTDDPQWVFREVDGGTDCLFSWKSGSLRADVPFEKATAIPKVGVEKPSAIFPNEMLKVFRGLLPIAPKDFIQPELHGVMVGKGYVASTDGLVLAYIPQLECNHDVLIPSEILSWSDKLPGSKLGVCSKSFVVFIPGTVVEQSAFAVEKSFPVERVSQLRESLSKTETILSVHNKAFLATLSNVSEWVQAGGKKLTLSLHGNVLKAEMPVLGSAVMRDNIPMNGMKLTGDINWVFDAKNLLLWKGIASGLDDTLKICTGDKLPYLLKCGTTELYLVKPG